MRRFIISSKTLAGCMLVPFGVTVQLNGPESVCTLAAGDGLPIERNLPNTARGRMLYSPTRGCLTSCESCLCSARPIPSLSQRAPAGSESQRSQRSGREERSGARGGFLYYPSSALSFLHDSIRSQGAPRLGYLTSSGGAELHSLRTRVRYNTDVPVPPWPASTVLVMHERCTGSAIFHVLCIDITPEGPPPAVRAPGLGVMNLSSICSISGSTQTGPLTLPSNQLVCR